MCPIHATFHYTCWITSLPYPALFLKSVQTSLHLLLAFITSNLILHIPLDILDIITSPSLSGVGSVLPLRSEIIDKGIDISS